MIASLLKLAVSVGLLWYVVHDLRVQDPQAFSRIWRGPVDLPRLALALVFLFGAMAAIIARWAISLRAVGVRCDLETVARVALQAFAVDFAAFGASGGDAMKVLLLGSGRRLRVLGSVLVDRILGLQCFAAFISIAVMIVGTDKMGPEMQPWLQGLVAASVLGLLLGVAVLSSERILALVERIPIPPRLGELTASLAAASRAYRKSLPLLLLAMTFSFAIVGQHVLIFYFVATALPGEFPTLAEQTVIVPLGSLSSFLPLPANSLGALDYALSALTQLVTQNRVSGAQALMTAMAVRVLEAVLAAVGVWASSLRRREVAAAVANVDEIVS